MKKFAILVLAFALMILPMAAMAVSVNNLADLKTEIDAGTTPIELTAQITISNTVTLSASAPVTITTAVEDAFKVTSGGNLTLGKNITINATNSILYANGGTITIDGASLKTSSGVNSPAFANNGGMINMKSGSIRSEVVSAAVSVSGAKVNVTGGTIESTKASAMVVKNGATAKIAGGTVKTTCLDPKWVAVDVRANSSVEISGGTIDAAAGEGVCLEGTGKASITGGMISGKKGAVYVYDTASMEVSGGTFSDDSAYNYLKPGLTLKVRNGKVVVTKISTGSMPATGDTSSMVLWMSLMAMAGVGLVYMGKLRRE